METNGKFLTEGQYYKWQCEVEKLYKVEAKAKMVELQMQVLQLQTQNCKLKETLYAQEVTKAKQGDEKSKEDYAKFMLTLSDEIGVDLKGKSINPVTFEVVEL